MRYNGFIVILFLLFLSETLYSQNVISGKVYDNASGEPLHGVYVLYEKGHGTITESDGTFKFASDSAKLNITFRFIGYRDVRKTIDLKLQNGNELNVGLDMEVTEIGQIVVSANKTEQKVAELTVSMDILKSGDFLKSHITDAQELITKTPGIEVMDGQASVRGGSGFSYGVGSRVLALIDGLPVLSPDAGSIKWQFLPLENISQIEIIKGASSVLYGSSALNGIINFRSSDATNVPETKFFIESGIYGKPANSNWVWSNSPRFFSDLSFSHLEKHGKTDIGVGINLLNDNGYRKYNDEKLGRISLRIKHHNEKIKGLVYGLNLNSGYTAKRDFILWKDATTGALKQDTSTVSLVHGTFLAIDPYLTFDNKGKIKHDIRMRIQSSNNRFPVRDNNNSDAFSIYTEYQLFYKLSDCLSAIAGVAENWSRVLSNFYGNHDGFNLAGFSQLEYNPVPRIKIVAGVRIEQNSLDGYKDNIVPIFRTGINWQTAEFTFLRASFGQGYRYPSIAEKFASTTLGSVKIFPNPFVKPESGWSSEAGIKQGIRIGNLSGQADISVFLSQNRDLIEFPFQLYPEGLGFRADNVEQSRVFGYETEFILNRTFNKLKTSVSGGYTYLYPVSIYESPNNTNNKYLKYRRKHSFKISTDCYYGKFDLGIAIFAKSKILNIDEVFLQDLNGQFILPGFPEYWQTHNTGYFLADASISYLINNNFTISIAAKNVTNTEYMGRPGDIQPQRNFSLKLSGSF